MYGILTFYTRIVFMSLCLLKKSQLTYFVSLHTFYYQLKADYFLYYWNVLIKHKIHNLMPRFI